MKMSKCCSRNSPQDLAAVQNRAGRDLIIPTRRLPRRQTEITGQRQANDDKECIGNLAHFQMPANTLARGEKRARLAESGNAIVTIEPNYDPLFDLNISSR
jgi:hypothetical protein